MPTNDLFPTRIETDRLVFERFNRANVDPFAFYDFVTRDDWREAVKAHMPWFHFQRLDEIADFVDHAEQQWTDRETARYLLRAKATDDIIGMTAYGPEWETRRAGSGIVLAQDYWGREFGVERASVFVEMTFEIYDLDAYYATCARDNEPSKRMIEKYVEKYGGRHEGLLRQHSSRPNGSVTDQHRFSITRAEYQETATQIDTLDFVLEW